MPKPAQESWRLCACWIDDLAGKHNLARWCDDEEEKRVVRVELSERLRRSRGGRDGLCGRCRCGFGSAFVYTDRGALREIGEGNRSGR